MMPNGPENSVDVSEKCVEQYRTNKKNEDFGYANAKKKKRERKKNRLIFVQFITFLDSAT